MFYSFEAINCICSEMIIVDEEFGLFVTPNEADYNDSKKVHVYSQHIYFSNSCFTI
jgi:hypothetical protein